MIHPAGNHESVSLAEPKAIATPRPAVSAAVQLSMEGIGFFRSAPLKGLERIARGLLERTRVRLGGDEGAVRARLETIRALAIAHPDRDAHAAAGTALALLQVDHGVWPAAIDSLESVRRGSLAPVDEAFCIYAQSVARLEIEPPMRAVAGCARALRILGSADAPSLRARIRRLALDGYSGRGDLCRIRRVLDRMRDEPTTAEIEPWVRISECDLLHAEGRLDAAEAAARDTLLAVERLGEDGAACAPRAASVLRRWGTILLDLQRFDDARRRILDGLGLLDPVAPQDRREFARLHGVLARVDLEEGDEPGAWEALRVAEGFFRQGRCHRELADLLVFCGEMAAIRQVDMLRRKDAREGLFEARAILRNLGTEQGIRRCDLALECLRAPAGGGGRPVSRPPRPARTRRLTQLGFLTCDPTVLLALEPLEALVSTSIPILIVGESGTGKEVLSRALHRAAGVRGPFVAVNCGALPTDLQESELFGHVRGAFTGAIADKIGLFEAADGGTLLLDEVGEMTPRAQVKLLRILELGEVRRVGETRTRRVHVRVLAATIADLAGQLRSGAFRRDLFFRLCGLKVAIPPLRDRLGDVPLLANHFTRLFNGSETSHPSIASDALDRLLGHDWPGNVRELRFTMERAVALTRALGRERIESDCIDIEGLPGDATPPARMPVAEELGLAGGLDAYLMNTERRLILKALEENGWNRTHAARSLGGISRTTLIGKMKRLGLYPFENGGGHVGSEVATLDSAP